MVFVSKKCPLIHGIVARKSRHINPGRQAQLMGKLKKKLHY